jgi:hypothetical protein
MTHDEWKDHHAEDKEHLKNVKSMQLKRFYCKKCDHQFENQRLFNRHCESKKHQFGQLTKEQLFCQKCNTQCQNKAKWDDHILTKKHLNTKVELTPEQLFCNKCSTQCHNSLEWNKHILTKKHNKVTPGSEETLQSQ